MLMQRIRHTFTTVKGSSIHSNRVQQAPKPQERRAKEASTNSPRTAVQKEQRKLPGIFSLFFSPPEPQVVKKYESKQSAHCLTRKKVTC